MKKYHWNLHKYEASRKNYDFILQNVMRCKNPTKSEKKFTKLYSSKYDSCNATHTHKVASLKDHLFHIDFPVHFLIFLAPFKRYTGCKGEKYQ